jgi:hypothetical protein
MSEKTIRILLVVPIIVLNSPDDRVLPAVIAQVLGEE